MAIVNFHLLRRFHGSDVVSYSAVISALDTWPGQRSAMDFGQIGKSKAKFHIDVALKKMASQKNA